MKNEKLVHKPLKAEPEKVVPPQHLATEYLANERTFLAWIRTGIAVISLGFVVSRFGLWLAELSLTEKQFERFRTGASVPVGIGMILFGGLLSVLAAWRYHVVNRQIEQGKVKADRGLIVLITILVMVLSLLMAAYMVVSVNRL